MLRKQCYTNFSRTQLPRRWYPTFETCDDPLKFNKTERGLKADKQDTIAS